MAESDPDELADQLEQETARLQKEIERLGDEVSSAREDWVHKRSDDGVPGAPSADRPEDDDRPPPPQSSDPEQGGAET
jgi:hypothetical protein